MASTVKYILSLILFFFCCIFTSAQDKDFYSQLSDATIDLTRYKVKYDPSYFSIPYPNGDLPTKVYVQMS